MGACRDRVETLPPPRAGLAPSPPAEKRGHRRDGRRRTTTEKVGGAAAVAIERLDRDARGIGRARARLPHPVDHPPLVPTPTLACAR